MGRPDGLGAGTGGLQRPHWIATPSACHAGVFAPYRRDRAGDGTNALDRETIARDYDRHAARPSTIGPVPAMVAMRPSRIVTFDPWGHRVAGDFQSRDRSRDGTCSPSIAITAGQLDDRRDPGSPWREGSDSVSGRERSCSRVGDHLRHQDRHRARLAPARASQPASELEEGRPPPQALVDEAGGGMYPDLVERPDLVAFLPAYRGNERLHLRLIPSRLKRIPATPDRLPQSMTSATGSDVFRL